MGGLDLKGQGILCFVRFRLRTLLDLHLLHDNRFRLWAGVCPPDSSGQPMPVASQKCFQKPYRGFLGFSQLLRFLLGATCLSDSATTRTLPLPSSASVGIPIMEGEDSRKINGSWAYIRATNLECRRYRI